MPIGSNQVAAITILAIIISFIGAIQLTFQQSIQTAIEQVNKSINHTYRNFVAINDAERAIITLLIGINKTLTDQIERDANLTKAETEQLIRDIGSIPDIAISVNKTLAKIESEQPQSNFTAQREAVENIEELKDDVNIIQGSILSLDNKVNELFFLENRNQTPSR